MQRLIVALAAGALARMLLNTARRFPYPFASSLARGPGVPLDEVTALSLFTETLPGARATMMSALGASGSLGRVLGALIGGPVWTFGGLAATAIVSAVLTALALVCFAGSLRAVRATARR